MHRYFPPHVNTQPLDELLHACRQAMAPFVPHFTYDRLLLLTDFLRFAQRSQLSLQQARSAYVANSHDLFVGRAPRGHCASLVLHMQRTLSAGHIPTVCLPGHTPEFVAPGARGPNHAALAVPFSNPSDAGIILLEPGFWSSEPLVVTQSGSHRPLRYRPEMHDIVWCDKAGKILRNYSLQPQADVDAITMEHVGIDPTPLVVRKSQGETVGLILIDLHTGTWLQLRQGLIERRPLSPTIHLADVDAKLCEILHLDPEAVCEDINRVASYATELRHLREAALMRDAA